jgi:hypothetical protein
VASARGPGSFRDGIVEAVVDVRREFQGEPGAPIDISPIGSPTGSNMRPPQQGHGCASG